MPNPTPAEVVLFDLFGVLTEHQPAAEQRYVVGAAGPAAVADPVDFWNSYWANRPPYDRAAVSAAEYWQLVAADLGTHFSPATVAALVEADCGSWRTMDPAMVGLLERLAADGQTIGLLSNIPEELAADFEVRHRWFGLFAVVAFSCRIGAAKPDPAAFEWCLRELGVDAAEVLFVDDRGENVEAAESLGIRGKLFVGSADLIDFLQLDADV
jgi:putative hydrolase of the HAD superfamily